MLYQWAKFRCHTFFPSQDIKPNVLLVLILTVDDITNFKACVRYFLSNFYFPPSDSPLKAMKSAFYFI